MEFIEFVEKFVELKNINLLPYQKEVIKQISQAIKEGNEIKIYCLASYGESFYKELLEAYYKELKGMKVNRVSKLRGVYFENERSVKEVKDDEWARNRDY